MTTRRGIGQFGEKQACIFLQKHAFLVVETNFYTRFGEIDIIAYDKKTLQLVFVEVKTRSNKFPPEYAITKQKYQRMLKSAWCFMSFKELKTDDYRFDSISIMVDKSKSKIKIRHIKGILCKIAKILVM